MRGGSWAIDRGAFAARDMDLTLLVLGDVVGRPGRDALKRRLAAFRRERGIDCCVTNAENIAGGAGITPDTADELFAAGCRTRVGDLTLRPVWTLLRMYLLQQGFLDGWRGLILAGLYACYTLAKYAYLWEREHAPAA